MTFKVASNKLEIAAQLEELRARAEAGEKMCVAIRCFNTDGTVEDFVFGGDSDEERAQVLADLQAKYSQLN